MDEKVITQLLRGSARQGNFTALQKTTSLRIVFLPELSADGALLYFHRLTGNVPTEIKDVDKPCEFTQRALKLESSSRPNSASGTISVFPCADGVERHQRFPLGQAVSSGSGPRARPQTVTMPWSPAVAAQ